MEGPLFKPLRPRPAEVRANYNRRLSDKLLVAFEQACEIKDLIVAQQLLMILEELVARPSPHPLQDRRKNIESLVGAHQRLWALKHQDSETDLQLTSLLTN